MIEKVKHKGIALAILAAAQFMVVLDATIVNVALPAIQSGLHFKTDSDLQWIITAYALAFGGFLLLGGRLADLFGRRKIFLAGVVVFALSSLAAGISQGPTELIVFRALQGLGGALLSPAALSLVLTIFKEGADRNKALGVWSMVAAGGGAVGLLLGGILTQYVGWRWIFFINVPIGALVFAAALRNVPASLPQAREKVDYVGAVTITGSLMSLVYGLAKASTEGWGATSTLISFGASIALMAIFIFNELHVAHPLMRLGIFKRRNVTGGSIVQLLMPAAMFGLFFYLSIYLQTIQHYSPTKTGLANLPFTLTIMVVAAVLSKRITKLNPQYILTFAPLLAAAGLLYFSRIPLHANYLTDILPGVLMMAAGMAAVFVTTSIATTNGISQKESGLVSGLLNTGQQVGGAIGLAVLTVISTAATKKYLAAAGNNPAVMPQALVNGFQQGFIVASFFAIAASIVALTVFKVSDRSAEDVAARDEADHAEAAAAMPGL
jgi:EmrB/QacA subfamily drug resistance transporter